MPFLQFLHFSTKGTLFFQPRDLASSVCLLDPHPPASSLKTFLMSVWSSARLLLPLRLGRFDHVVALAIESVFARCPFSPVSAQNYF